MPTYTPAYTGADELWVVPANVYSIVVDAKGAGGGGSSTAGGSNPLGAAGGRAQCTLAVTPGETLRLQVGQAGTTGVGARYGGGAASGSPSTGAGGGATAIYRGVASQANALVIGPGGGGAGANATGGTGGGTTGSAGAVVGAAAPAGGGTPSAGGSAGTGSGGNGAAGTALTGGAGGAAASFGGGGGGGGYYGGGGGGSATSISTPHGGGGGGSAFTTGTSTSTTAGAGSASAANGSLTITYTVNTAPTVPTVTAPNGGETIGTSTTNITWTASTDADGDPITYDLDYSTNNGGAWTSIAVGVGASPYVWNVSGVPSSAACLVRIRAVDSHGNASAYDQSNAVFTIQHNVAPNPATWASPPNNTTLDRSVNQTLTFNFLDPDVGDVMTKFDWRYRLVGAGTWTNTGTQMGATPSFTLAGGSVAAGTYEIQVLTYDGQGVVATGWSASLQFVMANAPAAPAITTPASGGTVSASSGVAAWTVANQTGYQVQQIADNAGVMADPNVPANVYSDTGQVTGVSAATARNAPQTYPVNNRYEWVRVRIQNSGLWSAWTSIRYQVTYTAPAAIVVGVSAPPTIPDILRVAITNPTPVGSQPVVATIELWRQRISDQAGAPVLNEAPTRVATMPPTSGGVTVFDDASVRSGHGYQYQAVVIGVNNVVTRSPWVV